MEDTKKTVKPIRWDNLESTFYWKIYLDPNVQGNTVEFLTGHSKGAGEEAKDKVQLIKRIIVRVFQKFYLHKCTHIKVYKRVGQYENVKEDKLIFVLRRNDVDLHPDVLKDYDMVHWFERFYKMRKDGGDFNTLIPQVKSYLSTEQYLDIDYQHLKIGKDMLKLNNYLATLFRNSHPPGAIVHFSNTYIAKFMKP